MPSAKVEARELSAPVLSAAATVRRLLRAVAAKLTIVADERGLRADNH
jgi:hypothetical protein